MRSRVTRFAFTLILASASACETQVHLVGAVELDPNCEARSTNAPLARGLLDLGAEGTAPRDYLAALVVETDVERITFDTIELWYSADGALDGVESEDGDDALPVRPEAPRSVVVGGTSASDVVFAPIVTRADAALLRKEEHVRGTLAPTNPAGDDRFRITSNVRLRGRTQDGGAVVSQELPIVVDVCQGCLVPECSDGRLVTDGCVLGQDDGDGACE